MPAAALLGIPNAYISTDEPPRRSALRSGLCLAALSGVAYLGLVILVLSFAPTGYDPVTEVASDYGVGAYGLAMNSGFLLAGVGVVCLATVAVSSRPGLGSRVGGALLFPSGLALVVNAFFQTDLEGAARTLHGTIHGFGGAVFFFTAPVGLLLTSYGFGRRRFVMTLLAFLAAVVLLAANAAFGLDASGLFERALIGVTFASLIATSLKFFKEA